MLVADVQCCKSEMVCMPVPTIQHDSQDTALHASSGGACQNSYNTAVYLLMPAAVTAFVVAAAATTAATTAATGQKVVSSNHGNHRPEVAMTAVQVTHSTKLQVSAACVEAPAALCPMQVQ